MSSPHRLSFENLQQLHVVSLLSLPRNLATNENFSFKGPGRTVCRLASIVKVTVVLVAGARPCCQTERSSLYTTGALAVTPPVNSKRRSQLGALGPTLGTQSEAFLEQRRRLSFCTPNAEVGVVWVTSKGNPGEQPLEKSLSTRKQRLRQLRPIMTAAMGNGSWFDPICDSAALRKPHRNCCPVQLKLGNLWQSYVLLLHMACDVWPTPELSLQSGEVCHICPHTFCSCRQHRAERPQGANMRHENVSCPLQLMQLSFSAGL